MHALNGCDTVSYPFNNGKVAALNVFKAGNFPNLFDTLGEEGVSLESVRETGWQFFAALYGQPSTVTMNEARRRIYTRKKGKPIRIMALPPTDSNLDFHVMWAHLQMKLWKAADKQGPPNLDITKFGWTIKDGVPSPSFSTVSPAPSGLIDVLSCGCKAEGKACSTTACLCHRNNLSCTIYCKCSGRAEICNNPSLIATPLPNPLMNMRDMMISYNYLCLSWNQ